jgi:hypothetical protein
VKLTYVTFPSAPLFDPWEEMMKCEGLVPRSAFRTLLIGLVAVSLLTSTILRSAQAAEGAQASWYQAISFKFKTGKAEEALKIIHDHFQKVDKAIGRKVIPFEYLTGEWDHVVYFPLDIAPMETMPSNTEWMKALAGQEGGLEQAQKLFQTFLDMVATSKTEIAKLPAAWIP